MASLVVAGDTSGSVTLSAPSVSGSTVLTLPTTTGTLVVTGGAQTIEFADGSAAAPSITNSGDTNTGMFFPAADTIAFTEGGTEAMRLDSSGNVGINTTSPGVKLGVVDTSAGAATFPAIFGNRGTTVSTQANIGLQTYDAGSAGITNVIGSVTTSATGGAGSADMVFQTTGSGTRAERMRIDSAGRITTPFQPCFHVRVNSGAYITTSPIPFSNAPINVGSHFNTSTYRFTAPIAGKYYFLLMLYVRINATNGDATAFVRVNSSNRQYLNYIVNSAISYNTVTMPSIFNLSAGDTVDYTFTSGSGGTYYGGNEETNLFGWLIG